MSAAPLFELNQQEKIEFRNGMVVVKDTGKIDDMILDFILEKFRKARKERSIAHWINKIASDERIYRISYLFLTSLKLRGFVTQKKMRHLDWKWNRSGPTGNSYLMGRFKVKDINKVIALQNQLIATLLDQENVDQELVTLIIILQSCGLSNSFLNKQTRIGKLLKLKMDEIASENTLGLHLRRVLSYSILHVSRPWGLPDHDRIPSYPENVYSGCHTPLPTESELLKP